jgi:hypothetical protein
VEIRCLKYPIQVHIQKASKEDQTCHGAGQDAGKYVVASDGYCRGETRHVYAYDGTPPSATVLEEDKDVSEKAAWWIQIMRPRCQAIGRCASSMPSSSGSTSARS